MVGWGCNMKGQTVPIHKLLYSLFVGNQRLVLVFCQWGPRLAVYASDHVAYFWPIVLKLLRFPVCLCWDISVSTQEPAELRETVYGTFPKSPTPIFCIYNPHIVYIIHLILSILVPDQWYSLFLSGTGLFFLQLLATSITTPSSIHFMLTLGSF